MMDNTGQKDSATRTAIEGGKAGALTRRSALLASGAVATSVFAMPTLARGDYSTIVDIVDDFGADPTGEESILEALHEAVDNDTKVVFPEGTYWIGGNGFHRWGFGEGREGELVENVALVGEGDVTLRPTPGTEHFIMAIWGTGVHIENFRIDQTAENTNVGFSLLVEDDLLVRDVTIEGVCDTFGNTKLGPGITDPDGSGLIENFRIPDGSIGFSRNTGVWMFPEHAGEIVFRQCAFEGLSDNAVYASSVAHPTRGQLGAVGVENCFFRNNNVSAIRLGSPGSYAKNSTVVYDGYIPEYDTWGAVTGRAAWLWDEFEGELRNIDVVLEHPRGFGFHERNQQGAVEVHNCRIRVDADGNDALRFDEAGPGELAVTETSITGSAGDGAAIHVANRELNVRNLCLHQSGADRDGLRLENVSGSIVESMIDVSGGAVVADEDSDVEVRNPREDGGCPPAQKAHAKDRA